MADGDKPIRNGNEVTRFVLLPDAGSIVHPAHRFGDQMVDVQLNADASILFKAGSLVWAWGTWRVLNGNPNEDKPLFRLQDAHIEWADKAEILKYFR